MIAQFVDPTGHNGAINNGFDYLFNHGPLYLDDMDASRAVFSAYQSYPLNQVNGFARLVLGENGLPGNHWHHFQPAQVYQNQLSILSDMLGGGLDAGQIAMQPLISGD